MKRDKRQVAGIVGTVVVHAVCLALLFLVCVREPQEQEEGGVPVVMGDTDLSQGMFDAATMTEVSLQENVTTETSVPDADEPEMITQTEEQTVSIPAKKEKTEEEKRAEAEKAAAELAASRIAGAFGKGNSMGKKEDGQTGSGTVGSPDGNASTGETTGVGGYGTFNLNGRSLGAEGLPRPVYNVQDEGCVVVTITVDPEGRVIGTSINKRTNTVNPSLRKAAEEAAAKARFNRVEGVNNQTGTIIYYFQLK